MGYAVFTYKLNSGVLAAEFEQWVRTRDRELVAALKQPHGPVISQTISRAGDLVFEGEPRFDFIEVLEFTNRPDFLRTLSTHPNAAVISTELKAYVRFVDDVFVSEV